MLHIHTMATFITPIMMSPDLYHLGVYKEAVSVHICLCFVLFPVYGVP